MSVENDIRSLHKEIQKNIIVMLPERYKKVCLYASVIDEGNLSNGEMFFYYFPSGILKKNPINVYEIPKLFDVEEEQYIKLEKALYESIKKLKRYCVTVEQNLWSNLTIIMEETKYYVEYNYDDLINSEFDNYSRHIIWRYKYLDIPIESCTKKEREIIERYFNSYEYRNSETVLYEENIYEKQINKVTIYDSVETHDDFMKKKVMFETDNDVINQLIAMDDDIENDDDYIKKKEMLEQKKNTKSQLLNNATLYNNINYNNNIIKGNISRPNGIIKNQLLNNVILYDNTTNDNIDIIKGSMPKPKNSTKNQLLNNTISYDNTINNNMTNSNIPRPKDNKKNQLLNF